MRQTFAAGLLGACALVLVAPPANAAASFEFLWSSGSVSDDDQFLLHLAVGNSGYSRQQIEPVLPRMRHPEEDLPVALFLAAESGRSLELIVDLRGQGLSWTMIFSRVGVSYEPLFVGIDRDPGPPYGKAWGHWRKSPRDCSLSDKEIVGLVSVQTGRRVTGLSAYDLARGQGSGKSVATMVADKKGRPKGGQGSAAAASGSAKQGGGKPAHAGKPGNSGKGGKAK